MTAAEYGNRPSAYRSLDPAERPELYEGVRTRRTIAFLIDAAILVALMSVAYLVLFVLGPFTLTLSWWLMPLVWPGVPILYEMFTLGGRRNATPGMQMMGIEMHAWNGEPMYPLLALVHSLLFWLSVTFLTPLVLVVALFTPRKRLLHDLALGTFVTRVR